MPILSSIPSTCITPLHLLWAIVLFIIILLLFRVDVLKFCRNRIIGKYDPSPSILLSTYNLEMLRQIFMLADKSTLREAMLLFWDEDIAFLGHTKWSTKHSGNNQRGTVKDTRSQVLEAVNISAKAPTPTPTPLFSPSLHTGADTQALFTQCLPVECIGFFFRFLFIQILIGHYPLSKEEFNKNSSGSHFEHSLMECTHVLSPMMPDKCGIDEHFYNQPFDFQ